MGPRLEYKTNLAGPTTAVILEDANTVEAWLYRGHRGNTHFDITSIQVFVVMDVKVEIKFHLKTPCSLLLAPVPRARCCQTKRRSSGQAVSESPG